MIMGTQQSVAFYILSRAFEVVIISYCLDSEFWSLFIQIYRVRTFLDLRKSNSTDLKVDWHYTNQIAMIWQTNCKVGLIDSEQYLGKIVNAYRISFISVSQSCLTLCDPRNQSSPGLPVHHQLPEFTQTHFHRVGDAIQPSHPLSSPSPPAPNPSQNQSLFQWVNSSHEVAKVLEFQL